MLYYIQCYPPIYYSCFRFLSWKNALSPVPLPARKGILLFSWPTWSHVCFSLRGAAASLVWQFKIHLGKFRVSNKFDTKMDACSVLSRYEKFLLKVVDFFAPEAAFFSSLCPLSSLSHCVYVTMMTRQKNSTNVTHSNLYGSFSKTKRPLSLKKAPRPLSFCVPWSVLWWELCEAPENRFELFGIRTHAVCCAFDFPKEI